MEVIVDVSKLNRMLANTDKNADDVLGKLAGDMETEIKTNWSSVSPSSPGSPPAVDTGNLTNSIVHEKERELSWVVNIGAEYGVWLEYGTTRMAARPFFAPAFRRVMENAPRQLLEAVIKVD